MSWQINKQRLRKEAPHQVMVLIKMEVIEMNSAGLMQGSLTARDSMLCTLVGKNFKNCIEKADKFKEEINNACKKINQTN